MWLGFERRTAGWWAHINPLSYGGPLANPNGFICFLNLKTQNGLFASFYEQSPDLNPRPHNHMVTMVGFFVFSTSFVSQGKKEFSIQIPDYIESTHVIWNLFGIKKSIIKAYEKRTDP